MEIDNKYSNTMTKDETKTILKYLNKSKKYLEFGAGNSTVMASSISTIQHIYTVESSQDYIDNYLMIEPQIQNEMKSGKLAIHVIDIGDITKWGFPRSIDKIDLWPNYSLNPFTNQENNYDLVFVDGRFRVACALSSILNTSKDCIIMIHDFWNRPRYHILLKFLTTIEKIDTLGVFIKKRKINKRKAKKMLRKYQYIPTDHPFRFKIRRILNIFTSYIKE